MKKRLLELFGLMLVGDGLLALLAPNRHCRLWKVGPQGLRDLVDEFAEHPAVTRWVGVAEAFAGVALAKSQLPAKLPLRRFL
jgi:hypothetical protein